MAVTALPWMNQCAEITSTARGGGKVLPSSRQVPVKRLFSNAFMGLPWPINAVGIWTDWLIYRRTLDLRKYFANTVRVTERLQ
jgi:hypothetical protein